MDRDKPWNESGIDGVQRFLDRVWRVVATVDGAQAFDDAELPEPLLRQLHKTIKKVGEDLENMSFNTAISAMMILTNEAYKHSSRSKRWIAPLAQLLAPFAPHIAEEIWHRLGEHGLIATAAWPAYETNLTVDSTVTIGVQVNGKSRGAVELATDATEAEAVAAAMLVTSVQNALMGQTPVKTIYKAGRILNLIVK